MALLPPKEFIRKIKPFSFLSEDELNTILSGLEVELIKKDKTVYSKGEARKYVYVIYSGLIGLYDDQTVVDLVSRGEVFGIVAGSEYPFILTAKALEDTVCYLVPAESFKKVLEANRRFSAFFITFLRRQFRSFRAIADDGKISEESAFILPVENILYKDPVVCSADVSLQEAVAKMEKHGVGSIVAVDAGAKPVGIFTHKDLRRAVAHGNISSPLHRFMSSPVKSVTGRAKILDALITMVELGIDHLVVTEHERVIGVVTRKDIQIQLEPSSSIISLFRRIVKAVAVSELESIFKTMRTIAAKVAFTGVSFYDLSKMISSAFDAFTTRVIELVREESHAGRFTWLHMGSSGRREQIIATDQDSAMIADGVGALPLARAVTETLNRMGIPLCTGDYMASNPSWNQDLSAWKGSFLRWFSDPSPDHVRYLSVFLDMRVICGEEEPYRQLVESIRSSISRKSIQLLAYDAIELEPPLGIFGIIGLHKGVDFKTYGIYPIVNGARVLALEMGIVGTTNTRDRLQELLDQGVIGGDLFGDLVESYGFIQDLRLRHQSAAVLNESAPDNLVRAREISKIDLLLLKESLKIVTSFQKFLMQRYGVRRDGVF